MRDIKKAVYKTIYSNKQRKTYVHMHVCYTFRLVSQKYISKDMKAFADNNNIFDVWNKQTLQRAKCI